MSPNGANHTASASASTQSWTPMRRSGWPTPSSKKSKPRTNTSSKSSPHAPLTCAPSSSTANNTNATTPTHSTTTRYQLAEAAPPPVKHTAAPGTPPRHIWLGVLINNQHDADQHIPPLLDTPAAIRFAIVDQDTPVDFTPWMSAAKCPACRGWTTPHTCTQAPLDLITMTIDDTRPINETWINDLHAQGDENDIPVDIHPAHR